jgi:hypothetical protein
VGASSCPIATRLLRNLHEKIGGISEGVPLADESHPLAGFSGDPASCVSPDLDDWEDILNPMMHRAFGYASSVATQNPDILKDLARRGDHGLDGFCRFIEYFVKSRGLQGGLLESKVELLIAAINLLCVNQPLPMEVNKLTV